MPVMRVLILIIWMAQWYDGETYLKMAKADPIITHSIRMDQCSAFKKTLARQYMNAANQRNHSKKAISMISPTIDV